MRRWRLVVGPHALVCLQGGGRRVLSYPTASRVLGCSVGLLCDGPCRLQRHVVLVKLRTPLVRDRHQVEDLILGHDPDALHREEDGLGATTVRVPKGRPELPHERSPSLPPSIAPSFFLLPLGTEPGFLPQSLLLPSDMRQRVLCLAQAHGHIVRKDFRRPTQKRLWQHHQAQPLYGDWVCREPSWRARVCHSKFPHIGVVPSAHGRQPLQRDLAPAAAADGPDRALGSRRTRAVLRYQEAADELMHLRREAAGHVEGPPELQAIGQLTALIDEVTHSVQALHLRVDLHGVPARALALELLKEPAQLLLPPAQVQSHLPQGAAAGAEVCGGRLLQAGGREREAALGGPAALRGGRARGRAARRDDGVGRRELDQVPRPQHPSRPRPARVLVASPWPPPPRVNLAPAQAPPLGQRSHRLGSKALERRDPPSTAAFGRLRPQHLDR
mmetsp:Transcript_163186/g.523395  ORF Transcript_163186/g.523395 Transcript_163186/m.523395 type:complete len:444 (+) Transcript_163186:698-2029(+)